MIVIDLLRRLQGLGVHLWADGTRLRYRGPEEALTPDLLEQLALHKQELLLFLRRRSEGIRPAPRDRPLPLSYGQQQLWLLAELRPDSPYYNEPAILEMRGRLSAQALLRAVNEIVRRHEVLRTTFARRDGRPVQVIAPSLVLRMPEIDLSSLAPRRRRDEILRLSTAEARRPFDLASGPLLRLTLLRAAVEEQTLLLTFHHLIHDGDSMRVFARELSTLYEAFSRGLPSPLKPPELHYADYAYWQRERLQGELLEVEVDFWRRRLEGVEAVLDLPLDYPRPSQASYRGARVPIALSAELTRSLERLAESEGATVFMVLLAGFFTLLHRYSGQQSIALGNPRSGRTQEGTAELLGFIVQTQVLVANLEGDPPLRQLLARVREAVLAAEAHSELPYELLVEELRPERLAGINPFFQVMLAFQRDPTEAFRLSGLELKVAPVHTGTAKLDLDVSWVLTARRLEGFIEYSTDLFAQGTVERLAAHYERLLASLAEDPGRALWDLSLLSDSERTELLGAASEPFPQPEPMCLHQLFSRWAEASPDRIAISALDAELSYLELDRRANRLAHILIACGLEPRQRVAMLLQNGFYQATALLATLKAGGTFLCLDARWPHERLAAVLAEVRPPVVIAESGMAGDAAFEAVSVPSAGAMPWTLLEIDALAEEQPATTPEIRVDPADPCYIAYTSGSTGRPKGIVQSHRSFAQFLRWQSECFEIRYPARFIQWATLSYDAAYCEIFGTLCFGATLCVAPPEVRYDPRSLLHWLRLSESTLLQVVPSFARHLLIAIEAARGELAAVELLPRLERVLLAGEVLPKSLASEWLETFGSRPALFNLYGPSEAVLATWLAVREVRPESFSIPVGRAISGRKILVLDRRGEPCPRGVKGEIHVCSPFLTLGYLERPEETRRAFLPNPFGDLLDGATIYRTGDQGRWLLSGELEFCGRLDRQVKIRGMRVEPGEIEEVLAQACGLVESAVVVFDDGTRGQRLVAFAVGDGESITAEEALERVRQRLPQHMVPAQLVWLEALPRTATGKIDRGALKPPPPQHQSSGSRVAPRNPMEEQIAAALREVLELDEVGVHDDFFSLGGHSLLAVRWMHRISERLGLDLSLQTLLEQPTVAAVAEKVAGRAVAGAGESPRLAASSPIAPRPRSQEPLPVSYRQLGLWLLAQRHPDSAVYNMPAVGRLRGRPQVAALRASLGAVVARHEALRTTFEMHAGQPVQKIGSGRSIHLALHDLGGLAAERREAEAWRLAEDLIARAFDLSHGPLMRAALLRLGAEDHLLVVVLHHAAGDRWSMGVIFRQWAEIYEALCQRRQAPAPGAALQYADYALWQRRQLRGERLDEMLAYWREQLEGAPPVLELPADRPRPDQPSGRGELLTADLSAALTAQLKALAGSRGVTLYTLLLTAFATLLYRYGATERVVIATPISGRDRPEMEDAVGFFVNTLLLVSDLSGDPSFDAALEQMRRKVAGALAHQALPFERLVEELRPPSDPRTHPLYQVMFSYQDIALPSRAFGDLELEPSTVPTRRAQVDLTLIVEEREGLKIGWEYSVDLFDRSRIQRMAKHFERLLAAVTAPDRRISRLALLAPAERQQLVEEWSPGRRETFPEGCLGATFARRARRFPEAIALECGEQALSYGMLLLRADRLASLLVRRGARIESRIGVYLDRGPEMIVALLGILRAGCVYVPLDPADPEERLLVLLRDAGVRQLLSEEKLRSSWPQVSDLEVVCMDDDRPGRVRPDRGSSREIETRAAPGLTPRHLAYVIFTSGSTGRPKGIGVSHGPALHHLESWRKLQGLGPGDRVLQFASTTFDVSLEQILPTLFAGACLVLRGPELPSAETFIAWAESRALSVASLPTAYWRQVVSTLPRLGTARGPRVVNPGGDRMAIGATRAFLRSPWRRANLLNGYGPTETLVTATTFTVPARFAAAEPSSRVPIGRPLGARAAYVLGRHGELAPIGVAGELHIGGELLARGYLERPARTAASFLPDRFSEWPGSRLYRTGDLVVRLPDGMLDFLGRIDHQVKVRGFRIELGEIEEALSALPGVREAAVAAREIEPGDRRLIAYVVSNADAPPLTAEALRRAAETSLPAYMLPTSFLVLDRLPRTASGKVDRGRLPEPREADAMAPARRLLQPRTEMETLLAELWSEALGVDRVGVDENFFSLGGDSIISLQVISRAYEAGVLLSPVQFFRYPTIAEMANVATRRSSAAAREDEETGGEIALTPIQRWFFAEQFEQPHHWNQSVLMELGQPLDGGRLRRALELVLRRHPALSFRFRPTGSGWIQMGSLADARGSAAADPMLEVDLAALPKGRRARAVEGLSRSVQGSLDITAGPLTRMVLIQRGSEPQLVLWVAHHLVVDGISWRILLDHLERGYQSLSLPPPSTSYRRWAHELVELAAGDELREELAHWLKSVAPDPLPAPDGPAAADTVALAASVTLELDRPTTEALLREAPRAYHAQVNDLLLTALAQSFLRHGGGRFAVELEGHGREELFSELDLSRTVGWFTSKFPLVLDISRLTDPLSAGEAIQAVKEQLRGVPRRGIGYGLLRYLAPASEEVERLRSLPAPRVQLNYLGRFGQARSAWPVRYLPDRTGPECGARNHRPLPLEVVAWVVDDVLRIRWTWGGARWRRATMLELAEGFVAALERLIAHCQQQIAAGFTPSDFPLLTVDQKGLDRLLSAYPALEDVYPLSPVQHGMAFHSLYAPGSGVYLEQLVCELRGDLDSVLFRHAWQRVLEHHPILRTAVARHHMSEPVQVVCRKVELPFACLDWRALDPGRQEESLQKLLGRDRSRGFDLSQAPLMRLHLLRLEDRRWRFVWTVHHLLFDGWAEPLVLHDVFMAYLAARDGRTHTPEPRRPFKDYIAWLADQDVAASEAFWRRALKGLRSATTLPSDPGATGGGEEEHREEQREISPQTSAALAAQARDLGLTLNTLAAGIWALLLGYRTGSRDVALGLTVSGRPADLAGVEAMIGMFINTLPARVALSPSASWVSWLRDLQSHTAEILEHSSSSLVDVQAWSDIPRGESLFNTILVFMNQPRESGALSEELARAGLEIAVVEGVEQTNYPLTVTVLADDSLTLQINYRVQCFLRSTVVEILDQFELLLETFLKEPEASLGALEEKLAAADRARRNHQAKRLQGFRANAFAKVTARAPRRAVSANPPLATPEEPSPETGVTDENVTVNQA